MAGRAGAVKFCLVRYRRDLRRDQSADHHGCDLPDDAHSAAIIAQAAATASLLTEGRFTLGVGTGEALNEHITGAKWPAAAERQEMLEEAVTIIAELFTGEQLTHHGRHYQVDTARLYSVPEVPPPIYVSGFGEQSARLAARIADGFICMGPQADLIKLYRDEGGG